MSKDKSWLINYSWRKWGFFSILIGLVFSYINSFTQIRIESPVLAIYSGFMEQSFFTVTQTNLTDELAIIFLMLGLLILIITKEKNETEHLISLRYKALIISFVINNILLVLSVLLVYGTGFIGVMIASLFSQAIIYIISFTILKIRNKGK
jgi:hypothetical protein